MSLAIQGGQVPLFAGFVNLEVSLSLSGSGKYKLEKLEEILAGDPLVPGTELTITSRYYVRDVHMPVNRKEDYSRSYEERQKSAAYVYELAGAKVDLGFIDILKVEAKQGKTKKIIAAPCACLVANVPNATKPDGYKVAEYPLKGHWADQKCQACKGRGYVHPRKNKAPMSDEISGSYGDIIMLVDVLPEAPDVPEGHCTTCGNKNHVYNCPVRAEEEAAKKKTAGEAKKAYKKETGQKAPDCFGLTYDSYYRRCAPDVCAAAAHCAKACGREVPALKEATGSTPDDDTKIHQCPYADAVADNCPCENFYECAVVTRPPCFGRCFAVDETLKCRTDDCDFEPYCEGQAESDHDAADEAGDE
jgi:hypothetical protein